MFNQGTYIERRNTLSNKFSSGILLFLGNIENPINFEHNTYHFRQDSNFLYYIGVKAPKLAALVDIDAHETILFGDEMSIDDIIWMGRQETLAEKALKSGIYKILPFAALSSYIQKTITQKREVHYLPPYQSHNKIVLQGLLQTSISSLSPSVPFIEAVVAQRSYKTKEEIFEIERSIDVAVDMHRLAIKMSKPGLYEYQISNAIQQYAQNQEMTFSYPPIVTKHGEILHNHYQHNKLFAGDMVLNDSGVETALGYASDLTRTFPVSNKFTELQEDIYTIVLHALHVGERLLQPGTSFKSIHLKACEALVDGLIQIGFMKGNAQDAVANHAHSLFFQCGLGHMMGLDVHDMEDLGEQYVGYTTEEPKDTNTFGIKSLRLGRNLEEDFVLTIEPGIYIIPELIKICHGQNLYKDFINYDKVMQHLDFGGIRIEDNYLVQADGYRRLGKYLERELTEIYALKGNS